LQYIMIYSKSVTSPNSTVTVMCTCCIKNLKSLNHLSTFYAYNCPSFVDRVYIVIYSSSSYSSAWRALVDMVVTQRLRQATTPAKSESSLCYHLHLNLLLKLNLNVKSKPKAKAIIRSYRIIYLQKQPPKHVIIYLQKSSRIVVVCYYRFDRQNDRYRNRRLTTNL